jgi:hypothetical protein
MEAIAVRVRTCDFHYCTEFGLHTYPRYYTAELSPPTQPTTNFHGRKTGI